MPTNRPSESSSDGCKGLQGDKPLDSGGRYHFGLEIDWSLPRDSHLAVRQMATYDEGLGELRCAGFEKLCLGLRELTAADIPLEKPNLPSHYRAKLRRPVQAQLLG